ncbi:hypothetical protein AURDEDRAFT_104033, partial [Auricularia subglabra TFB-10046 SS5]
MYAKDEALNICNNAVEKYDSELCKAYREEIDTLLVFAGLFSAVVTGFTIESYQWLNDDPSDAMISLLAQIAQSVSANDTAPLTVQSSSGMPLSVSTRINAYWFVSLSLSLVAALVGILGKQWVREFERRATVSPKMALGVRQIKLEGLEYWRVGDIISALPLLLQLSLGLFALGILELLWHLRRAVFIAVSIPTLAALFFYLATTYLPMFQYSRGFHHPSKRPQCPFKSPQAFLALQSYQLVERAFKRICMHLWQPL